VEADCVRRHRAAWMNWWKPTRLSFRPATIWTCRGLATWSRPCVPRTNAAHALHRLTQDIRACRRRAFGRADHDPLNRMPSDIEVDEVLMSAILRDGPGSQPIYL
jgi:hypothetical protein